VSPNAAPAGRTPPEQGVADFRALYRKLGHALAEIERTDNVAETLERILEALIEGFRDELGFEGARIYRREDGEYVLCCGLGASGGSPVGLRVPRDYGPHVATLERGIVIMRKGDPGWDEAFERAIGVESTFAAMTVGPHRKYVLAFSIAGDVHEERVLYSLTALRHVINLKLERERFEGMIEEARAIQESMLPPGPPDLAGWDLAGRSRPAERVGGDLFDYLPLPDGRLGIAIADATGHGLPAALIARDVITALRALVDGSRPPEDTVARLNRLVHGQALSSKFVSLFYGEIGPDGRLTYCNAGHNAPIVVRADAFAELGAGGPVLGPLPDARYDGGETVLAPGDVLAMFTDGVVERENDAGDPFGPERLRTAASSRGATAARVLDAIWSGVESHAGRSVQVDDMSVVVIRRTGG